MDSNLIPADVGREVWQKAEDRCQCMSRDCHGRLGRCTAQLNSGEGRVFLADPGKPKTASNCVLLCLKCLANATETKKPS